MLIWGRSLLLAPGVCCVVRLAAAIRVSGAARLRFPDGQERRIHPVGRARLEMTDDAGWGSGAPGGWLSGTVEGVPPASRGQHRPAPPLRCAGSSIDLSGALRGIARSH